VVGPPAAPTPRGGVLGSAKTYHRGHLDRYLGLDLRG